MSKQASKKQAKTTAADQPQTRKLMAHEILRRPSVQSAAAQAPWGSYAGEVELSALAAAVHDQTIDVIGGDTKQIEAMLFGQAKTLETLFTALARRAHSQEYLPQFQAYLGLALKAQAQCRSTLEVLSEIKNPRQVAFVKQANIAHQQQVNNGQPQPAAPSETIPAQPAALTHDPLEAVPTFSRQVDQVVAERG